LEYSAREERSYTTTFSKAAAGRDTQLRLDALRRFERAS
jgi:hypothetical protein